MIKGNITLANGAVITIEADSEAEFSRAAKALVGVSDTQMPAAAQPAITAPTKIIRATSSSNTGRGHAWTEHDMSIALEVIRSGVRNPVTEIYNRLRESGNVQCRQKSAVRNMARKVGYYLKYGTETTSLTKNMMEMLVRADKGHMSKAARLYPHAGEKGRHTKHDSPSTWSSHDITGVARILVDNFGKRYVGVLTRGFIRNNGDKRDRSDATISTITSNVKGFLLGDERARSVIGQKMQSYLESNGYEFGLMKSRKVPVRQLIDDEVEQPTTAPIEA